MSEVQTVLVEITGDYRSGTSQKGNPYCMFEGYVHLPNRPYPEKASFYAEKVSEVPPVGTYRVDAKLSVKDGRVTVDVDPRNGVRTELPSLSKVMKPGQVA